LESFVIQSGKAFKRSKTGALQTTIENDLISEFWKEKVENERRVNLETFV
jgi:hypothetical protein